MVSQSKGVTPARDPGFDRDLGSRSPTRGESSRAGVSHRWPSLRKVSVLRGPWRFPGIPACVGPGFHSGAPEGPLPDSFLSTPSSGRTKKGERFIWPQHKRTPECCDWCTIFQISGTEPCASVP